MELERGLDEETVEDVTELEATLLAAPEATDAGAAWTESVKSNRLGSTIMMQQSVYGQCADDVQLKFKMMHSRKKRG